MVLVSLAKINEYYTVDGKMLLLESKKWIPSVAGQPDMDGTTFNLGGTYDLIWANGLRQNVPANTQLMPYSFFGGKRKTKSKRTRRRKMKKTLRLKKSKKRYSKRIHKMKGG
jgi:hypothetical protein